VSPTDVAIGDVVVRRDVFVSAWLRPLASSLGLHVMSTDELKAATTAAVSAAGIRVAKRRASSRRVGRPRKVRTSFIAPTGM
jgi:hypothetical protein